MKKSVFLAVALLALMAAALSAQTDPGLAWRRVENSPFGTSTVNDVAFANNYFVAVGNSGKIAYSRDGRTWTAVADSTFGTSNINAVIAGPGAYIMAVGDGGKIRVSTGDPDKWLTARVPAGYETVNFKSVIYNNGVFIAAGTGGKLVTTGNASMTNWTAVNTSVFGANDIVGIAFGNGRYIAVTGEWDNRIFSSTNGTAWTEVRNAAFTEDDEIKGIVFINNMFFIVGGKGGRFSGNQGAYLAYSRDGLTWTGTAEDAGFIVFSLYDIAFGGGRYIAVGRAGFYYSTDNVTWRYINDYTPITGNAIGPDTRGIVYGANKFVIVATRGILAYLE